MHGRGARLAPGGSVVAGEHTSNLALGCPDLVDTFVDIPLARTAVLI
jgi:hypothetical protein